MSNLTVAAQALLRAQERYDELATFFDNLPADRTYDLGFSCQLAWGGSTTGAKTVIYELHQRLRPTIRDHIETMKREAWQALLQAERDVQEVAKGHRRA